MNAIQFFKSIGRLRRDAIALDRSTKEITMLRESNLQFQKDAMLYRQEDEKKYVGNEYRDYGRAIEELDRKYNGIAEWGVFQAGNIIDLRAVFIIAEGVKVTKIDPEARDDEMEFANAFLEYNDLDREMAQEFSKEAEIEGKILVKLAWEPDDEQIAARFISWTSKKYKVICDPLDYMWYKTVEWTPTGDTKAETIEEPYFVYKKFGGRLNQPNTAVPRTMKCLTQIESLDKALRDWREINRLFSAPVPVVQYETALQAQQAQTDLDKINWKVRKALSMVGEFSFVQPSMSGIDSLEREIITLAKMISGTTGVPVHFLGLPDLLSNRSTAENLMEMIFASTLKERQIWIGAYSEMIAKAMAIYNDAMGQAQSSTALDPQTIKIDIPFYSAQYWSMIKDILIPLSLSGKISDELILSKIPGIDALEEIAKRDAEESKNAPSPSPFRAKEKTSTDNPFNTGEEEIDEEGT